MLYTVEPKTGMSVIKEEISAKAKDLGFGVLKEYNFKDMLKERGFPIEREIAVFELCNPAAAQEALSKYPDISVYLPCRISVYEKDDKTILSTIAIEEMLKGFDIDEESKKQMRIIFENLKKLISSWE